MVALTDQEYGALRDLLFARGTGKEELKALPALPSEPELRAAFQVLEDYWDGNKAAMKTGIDAALGGTIPPELAKKIGLAWLSWKVSKGG
jgi:hypothetical protein